jgi:protein-L-isoaspartate(D-aspartate) O-methyltransferase
MKDESVGELGQSRLQGLIQGLKTQGALHDVRIEDAMRAAPRHLFLPDFPLDRVYEDEAILTKQEGEARSSCSQPTVVAQMLEMLDLNAGDSVLEIGAGTGWNAALMANLVGPEGRIVTLDIDEDTAQKARANLQRAGVANVETLCADGGRGAADLGPYDAIIATAATEEISPYWLEQLKPDGRLVAPLAFNTIEMVVTFHRRTTAEGVPILVGNDFRHFYFIPLRGAFAGSRLWTRTSELQLTYEPAFGVNGEAVVRLLGLPPAEVAFPLLQGQDTVGLMDYIALRGEPLIAATLIREAGSETLQGLALPESLALVPVWWEDTARQQAVLQIRTYGDMGAVDRLCAVANEWIERGRPDLNRATLTVAPMGVLPAQYGAFTARKRWMDYRVAFV